MVEQIRQLHEPQAILRNRTRQFVKSLEEDSQDLDLISSVKPERIGVLERSISNNYESYALRTQNNTVDLGTYFSQSKTGENFILEQLQNYIVEQGYEPQALLQMTPLSHLLPINETQEPADSIYIVNGDWLRAEEYAELL